MQNFNEIISLYRDSYNKFGDSPKSLLTPKGKHDLRFSAIKKFALKGKSILDFGCGLGYLYNYILRNNFELNYTGVDITDKFIENCQKKYPKQNFKLIEPNTKIVDKYDITFISGVFNIKIDDNEEKTKEFAFNKIKELFNNTNDVLICDFLSPNVDFKYENAMHFKFEDVINFCIKELSRKFIIRHDLLPYEYSLIIYKNDEIRRPENCYLEDFNEK